MEPPRVIHDALGLLIVRSHRISQSNVRLSSAEVARLLGWHNASSVEDSAQHCVGMKAELFVGYLNRRNIFAVEEGANLLVGGIPLVELFGERPGGEVMSVLHRRGEGSYVLDEVHDEEIVGIDIEQVSVAQSGDQTAKRADVL